MTFTCAYPNCHQQATRMFYVRPPAHIREWRCRHHKEGIEAETRWLSYTERKDVVRRLKAYGGNYRAKSPLPYEIRVTDGDGQCVTYQRHPADYVADLASRMILAGYSIVAKPYRNPAMEEGISQ